MNAAETCADDCTQSHANGLLFQQAANQRGFTLLEIVVAVAVFAIVAVVIYGRTGDVLNQTGRLEQRTLATWIADNALTNLSLSRRQPGTALPAGRTSQQLRMAGREWRVDINVVATSQPTLERVDIEVRAGEGTAQTPVIAQLVGFLGAN